VRSFFDPTGQSFDAKHNRGSAFIAGNDMLYLEQFHTAQARQNPMKRSSDPGLTSAVNTRKTLLSAQRVDQAVLRILNVKLQLYGEFTLETVVRIALAWTRSAALPTSHSTSPAKLSRLSLPARTT
jgi:beta-N-acetylhexosaminidase